SLHAPLPFYRPPPRTGRPRVRVRPGAPRPPGGGGRGPAGPGPRHPPVRRRGAGPVPGRGRLGRRVLRVGAQPVGLRRGHAHRRRGGAGRGRAERRAARARPAGRGTAGAVRSPARPVGGASRRGPRSGGRVVMAPPTAATPARGGGRG